MWQSKAFLVLCATNYFSSYEAPYSDALYATILASSVYIVLKHNEIL